MKPAQNNAGNRPVVPDGIGPHEGRELDLLLAGEKPLAMFSDVLSSDYVWPDERFAPFVSKGALVKREFITETADGRHKIRHLYFALPNEAWRIEAAHDLSCKHFPVWCDEAEEVCANLGRLLGYREEDIQTFLAWAGKERAAR